MTKVVDVTKVGATGMPNGCANHYTTAPLIFTPTFPLWSRNVRETGNCSASAGCSTSPSQQCSQSLECSRMSSSGMLNKQQIHTLYIADAFIITHLLRKTTTKRFQTPVDAEQQEFAVRQPVARWLEGDDGPTAGTMRPPKPLLRLLHCLHAANGCRHNDTIQLYPVALMARK